MESTTALKVATGIVNIWSADAKTVAESFHRINAAYPGRFLLGIGAGHPEHTEEYRKPYDALVDYLERAVGQIEVAVRAVATHVAQHAIAIDGPIREYFLVGPQDTRDETAWRTEIGWPVFHTTTS